MFEFSRIITCLLSVVGLVSTSACGGEPECVGDATLTIEQWIPESQQINCEDSRSFEVDSRQVAVTRVHYGIQRDCPSGCFSATLCAIEDEGQAHLIKAFWNDDSEQPLGIEEECPDLELHRKNTRDCDTSGASHPVTETEAFRNFAQEQEGTGPMRHCFDRYDHPEFFE